MFVLVYGAILHWELQQGRRYPLSQIHSLELRSSGLMVIAKRGHLHQMNSYLNYVGSTKVQSSDLVMSPCYNSGQRVTLCCSHYPCIDAPVIIGPSADVKQFFMNCVRCTDIFGWMERECWAPCVRVVLRRRTQLLDASLPECTVGNQAQSLTKVLTKIYKRIPSL